MLSVRYRERITSQSQRVARNEHPLGFERLRCGGNGGIEHGVRTVSIMESAPGPEVILDGKPYLYFGGTSYLGLAAHPEVIRAGCDALSRFGVHSATSRAGMGTNPPLRDAEQRAAQFFQTQEAFFFSSGYVTNHILVSALSAGVEHVVMDEAAHYCLGEAARLVGKPVTLFRSRDAKDLCRRIRGRDHVLALSDTVCASTGRVAPVRDYLEILGGCSKATLILDEAHGFGVLGPQGRGLVDSLGLFETANGGSGVGSVTLAVGGTLSKALGGYGGVIPGTRDFVDAVRRASHYFEGASAPASASAASTAKALEIVMREPALREQLRLNQQTLRAGLRSLGLDIPEGDTAHFGFQCGDARNMQRLHEALRERGILVPYFPSYSGVPEGGVLRVAVFANHRPDQLDRLLSVLRDLL